MNEVSRIAALCRSVEKDVLASSGFAEPQLAFLRQLLPTFAVALKCISLGRVAQTLVTTYLGRDAGRRVLSGRIGRGVAERISAVLWYSDLRGYTRITEAAEPDEIIPFLNDYADAIISSVHDTGGDVLKLIGDGTLAIFTGNDPGAACAGALKAGLGASPLAFSPASASRR